VEWDVEGDGRVAAELLLQRMGGFAGPRQQVMLPTRLTLRESCAPPYVDRRGNRSPLLE